MIELKGIDGFDHKNGFSFSHFFFPSQNGFLAPYNIQPIQGIFEGDEEDDNVHFLLYIIMNFSLY